VKRGEGRPTGGYYTKDGIRVPSATGITGRGKDSGGLVYVAKRNWWEAGKQGKPFDRDAYWSDSDALLAGTVVHQWIEDDIHGQPLTRFDDAPARTLAEATTGYDAFCKWRVTANLTILETETPLVSEQYEFGGTLDAIARINGERVLFDWKTSNATYVDYIAQVAAYRQLVNEDYETLGNGGPVESAYLLRVGKEFGDFHLHFWTSRILDLGWRWFLAAKELYDMDKRLKKVAA